MKLVPQIEPSELIPFEEGVRGFKLYAIVSREGDLIRVEYRLGGERRDEIVFPALAAEPTRKDGLWERTCLELFFAEAVSPWYWEVNLSPSLDWQAYHFRGYRDGRKPESRIARVRAEKLPENSAGHGFLLELETSALFSSKASLDIGVSVVLSTQDDQKSYWALAHAGSKPDFHQRKSFVLRPPTL
jgi:hypothetical protein